MNKMACSKCGVTILARTAMRNDGQCVPCRNGTRQSIEAGRLRYREELEQRERDKTDPAHIYWGSLLERVYKTEAGFEGLSDAEKKFFAVCCLDGDVYNGGFQQFFFNSAGAYYEHALSGLAEMGADESLQLLKRAKQVWFDFAEVPTDTGTRRQLLDRNSSRSHVIRSDELDKLYCKDPDGLAKRSERYALEHELYRCLPTE